MLKKYCALNILKQWQYKAFSGNSCSGTVIKFILFYFILFYDTTFVIDNIITCNYQKINY